MVPRGFGPVADPLEMIFGLLQWAIALVYSQRIAEVKPTVSVYVECRHATSFGAANVQSGKSRVFRRRGTHAVGLHSHAIPVEPKTEIGD